ncbi:methylenetetrahydrofolate reductase C-terminal domain-containing protein [bacterium]|nr:methylenetetrahydrofolate reductase C-terminal domain-containing protein [bacterium]
MNKEKDFDELVTLKKRDLSRGEKILSKIMLFFEDLFKVPLFKCHHCGECILSHTGFVCSQRCPKRLRNGPCGGTRANGHCEVYPERKCVWYMAFQRARRLRRTSLLHRIEKIHNWELEKTSAWLNVWTKQIEPPTFIIRSDDDHDIKKQD